MATIYDQASLVMLPSGYKDTKLFSIKPTDGSGDFTFSRDGAGASPATRVNASGLIEKGRENILLQSNSFDNTWTNFQSTESSGHSGYDGTNDAWKLTRLVDGANGVLYQTGLSFSLATFSIYAKAAEENWIYIEIVGSTFPAQFFDLQNGVKGTASGVGFIDSTITSVGGGWYRISITANVSSGSRVSIYNATADNTLSGSIGDGVYIQDAQVELGLVATDYIETTTAPVSAGLLGDMPRLDYSGGATCPSLLLEPSRTNLIVQSEYFGSNWNNNNLTITPNATTSPEGLNNASLLTSNNPTGGVYRLYETSTSAGQAVGTASVFMKYVNNQYAYISQDNYSGISQIAVFDLINGTNTFVSSGYTATITPYADGWYRCTITGEQNTLGSIQIGLSNSSSTYTGNIANGQSVYFWGAQREYNSSYVSSYIPTYGSASTRGVDNANKVLPDSILGTDYNEGTLFFELELNQEAITRAVSIESAFWTTSSVRIECTPSTGLFACDIVNASVGATGTSISVSPLSKGDTIKCALAWNNGTFVFYANGQSTSGSCPVMTTKIYNLYLNRLGTFNGVGNYESNDFKQVLVFPTALTNAELAALTTL